jgi:hypothetical protein
VFVAGFLAGMVAGVVLTLVAAVRIYRWAVTGR